MLQLTGLQVAHAILVMHLPLGKFYCTTKKSLLPWVKFTHFLILRFIHFGFWCFDFFFFISNRSSLNSWFRCSSQAAWLWSQALACHTAQCREAALHDELNCGLADRCVGGEAWGQRWCQRYILTVHLWTRYNFINACIHKREHQMRIVRVPFIHWNRQENISLNQESYSPPLCAPGTSKSPNLCHWWRA